MRIFSYLIFALAMWIVFSGIRRFVHRMGLRRMGDAQYATVTYASGTGSFTNRNPDLLVTLEYTGADGQTYRRDTTQNFNYGQLPRRGDRMKIWVNPNNPADFDIADKNPIPPGYNA